MAPPMVWEGKKGQPSTPVMPLDLAVRPYLDGKYIVPKTVDFIKTQAAAEKPFFVYVGYTEMHPPLGVDPEFAGKSAGRGGEYADLLGEMDYRVGQILDAIKDGGVDDNTLVILSSDNGTGGVMVGAGGSNGPWGGNFMTPPYEGSYRTAAMVRWPGTVPAGVVTQQMFAALDWFPTLAGIAGASNLVPKDRPIDGIDASAFLLGKSDTTGRETYMFFGPDGQLMSVKWKIYKTIFRYCEGVDKPIVAPQFPIFYDLSSDPHENFNLFSTKMDNAWVLAPVFKSIASTQMS